MNNMLLLKLKNFILNKTRHHKKYCDWSHLDPSKISIPPLPSSLNIELSSECNFKGNGGYCPLCAPMLTGGRAKGLIKRRNYEKLINDVSSFVKDINFVGHGEPTAHPEAWELIGYASRKGISTYICTNGLSITPNDYARIISANISKIEICLDGMTEKAHKSYRKGSDFKKLIKTITDLALLKNEGKLKSKLSIQTIALKTNEHEIHEIAEWCKTLRIGHRIQQASFGHDRIGNQKQLKGRFQPENVKLHRAALNRNPVLNDEAQRLIIRCPWVDKAMVLHSGDIIKCCYDFEGNNLLFGNAFTGKTFIDIWNGEQHLELLKKIHLAKIAFCFSVTCDRLYKTINTL